MEGKKVIWNSQHGSMKGKLCLTDLIAFLNEMTGSVDEGRAVGVVLTLVRLLTLSPIAFS